MRNVFDQYGQNENRLTHALVSALYEDNTLCRAFLKWVLGSRKLPKNVEVLEQQLVGDPPVSEETAEQRGLPDAWFHDADTWSLLVESKVKARLNIGQLQRHYKTAQSRGFTDIHLLVLTVTPEVTGMDFAIHRTWSQVYSWLKQQSSRSRWAGIAARYMEIVDAAWSEAGYLTEGTLTVFTGIQFDDSKPYNYQEAKLYLKQAMSELRKRKDLRKVLQADTSAPGRGAITGREGDTVWDFIPLKAAADSNTFTACPHLTLYISRQNVGAMVSLPNGLRTDIRRLLRSLGEDRFLALMKELNHNFASVIRRYPTAIPTASLLQRHYPSQRAKPVIDANLEFDLRTAFPSSKETAVKFEEEWLRTSYRVLSQKRSNMHFGVGIKFPYAPHTTGTQKILDGVCETWKGCKPLLDYLLATS